MPEATCTLRPAADPFMFVPNGHDFVVSVVEAVVVSRQAVLSLEMDEIID
jgi:hypothetical protein